MELLPDIQHANIVGLDGKVNRFKPTVQFESHHLKQS